MEPIVQVAAAIIERSGKIFIAQRAPRDRMAGLWEFPGGKLEAGETAPAGLRRELREELGMDASVGKALGESHYRYDHIAIRLIAYQVFWHGDEPRLNVHQAYRWVAPDRLYAFAFTPADLPFVHQLARGEMELESGARRLTTV